MFRFVPAWNLRSKIVVASLVVGTTPFAIMGWRTYQAAGRMGEQVALTIQSRAATIAETIDRNLFERYGDVQAFGVNDAVRVQADWYRQGRDESAIVRAINSYTRLYGVYRVSMVVDLEGRVVAVNDEDATGKPIDTRAFYGRNYRQAAWFTDALAGRFLTMPGGLTGTVVGDAVADDEVTAVYGQPQVTVSFSAPVPGPDGTPIAVWHNRASFDVVDEIIASAQQELVDQGLLQVHLAIADRQGRLISERVVRDGKATVTRGRGGDDAYAWAPADLAVLARVGNGHGRSVDPDGGADTVGIAVSKGALGYAGLGWTVIARVDERYSMAAASALIRELWLFGLAITIAVAIASFALARSLARPIAVAADALDAGAREVAATAGEVASAGQSLSAGATDQVEALRDTTMALESIDRLSRACADNAESAAASAADAGRAVERSTAVLQKMVSSMDDIRSANARVAGILKTIDEIAFQTNILALNAAVEAARAGEAGMGFAVVADEVRNLAQRSAQAARDTEALISESMGRANGGVTQVEQVVSAIDGITSSVKAVDHLVTQVRDASAQQVAALKQIAGSLESVDRIAQRTTATAEESAASSEELSANAQCTIELVAELRVALGGGGEDAVTPSATRSAAARAAAAVPRHPRLPSRADAA